MYAPMSRGYEALGSLPGLHPLRIALETLLRRQHFVRVEDLRIDLCYRRWWRPMPLVSLSKTYS